MQEYEPSPIRLAVNVTALVGSVSIARFGGRRRSKLRPCCVHFSWPHKGSGRPRTGVFPRRATLFSFSGSHAEQPILSVTGIGCPFAPLNMYFSTSRRIFSAVARAFSREVSGRTIRNSSPPYRLTTSLCRVEPLRIPAISRNTMSPLWCPCVSLTCLKKSTSAMMQARGFP